MTAKRGEKLADNKRKASGVSQGTASVIGEVIGGGTEDIEKAKAEFEKRAVWLEGMTSVSANQYGAWTNSWSEPRQGKYGKALTRIEFFTIVGRDDLSQQIVAADNSGARSAAGFLTGTGMLAAIVGGSMLMTGLILDMASDDGMSGLTLYSGIGTAAGVAMLVGGSVIRSGAPQYPDVPLDQIREMADAYNDSLKKELGLKDSDITASSQLYVAPVLGPTYAGGIIGFTF